MLGSLGPMAQLLEQSGQVEVGIRKAVGAKRKDIALQFLIESVTLSTFGGLTGIAIGWVGTLIMRGLYPTLPVQLSVWSVTMAFFFSLTVGVFFGVYPAVKASGGASICSSPLPATKSRGTKRWF